MSKYATCLDKEGDLLISGFLNFDIEDLKLSAQKSGLVFVTVKEKNNWVLLHFIKQEV